MATRNETAIYLKTGDLNLDQMLSMDADQKSRGIRCFVGDDDDRNTPVVLILGAAGTGKTTLALQIASAAAGDASGLRVFFYSLEQSIVSLRSAYGEFGFACRLNNDADPFVDFATNSGDEIANSKIHLCHFSDLPILAKESGASFDDRFKQLCHMIASVEVRREDAGKISNVFIIDSLNAIAHDPLTRSDIYRLFSVFRSQGIPVIITAERPESGGVNSAAVTESAKFLADIVIELTKDTPSGHLLQYIEITKSRVRRQALGRHLYKVRVPKAGREREDTQQREAGGIVVYPSIPCVISMLKDPSSKMKIPAHRKRDFEISASSVDEVGLRGLFGSKTLKPASRIAVLGPYGTHKFALAANIAAGLPRELEKSKGPRLLLISFGGYDPVDFSKVAWLAEGKEWAKCKPPASSPSPKWWETPFYYDDGTESAGTGPKGAMCGLQLSFRLGHLAPEECFHEINELIKRPGNKTLRSVLLSDTGQICAGFPLLRREPLFLPTLLDLFHEHGLLSVCIGVDSGTEATREMDFALQSCSDVRIYHSHDQSIKELAYQVTHPDAGEATQQQRVCVVVDNVSGKEYQRAPNWLHVRNGRTPPAKELFCGSLAKLEEWRATAPQ